jgi:ABC-type antimicrobial peptide transport system permease subunit
MAMTLAGTRIVDRFLFGVSVYDPLTLVSVVVVLGGVTLIACAIPAWRAARVDPAIALRVE